jgi:alkylresorcinol/alkylpyrone synthase
MRIAAAASALPKHSYDQATILAAIQHHWSGRLDNPEMLQRLHAHTGVDRRHLALPIEEYPALIERWGDVNNAWIRVGLEIGSEATLGALKTAGIAREALGAIFFVSVTGICSPSLDAKLVNELGLSRHIKRVPIFGLGCVAGAAGIARAADYVRAFPDQAALLVSVELCSLTVQQDDFSVANLISSGLFGDGAAAVIVTGSDFPSNGAPRGPEILATRSVFYPQTEGVMGWDISEKGFRIVLTRDVPGMVYKHLAPDIGEFLADHGLSRGDIGAWIMHTGGPAILRATADALGVPDSALEPSWACLRRVGNLSSSSVLFVLEDYLQNHRPPEGTMSVLAAMGPGFCSELVLLRW